MNECFLIGYIAEDVKFDFILNGKNDSKSICKMKLLNETVVTIIAFDRCADYCYRNLTINSKVMVYGRLTTKCNVIIRNITKL